MTVGELKRELQKYNDSIQVDIVESYYVTNIRSVKYVEAGKNGFTDDRVMLNWNVLD